MELKDYIEKEFKCKLDISEVDLKEFLKESFVFCYDNMDIEYELQSEIGVADYVMDFINIKDLAEYLNYIYVNEDCYIDNNSFESLKEMVGNNYDNDLIKAIKDWDYDV